MGNILEILRGPAGPAGPIGPIGKSGVLNWDNLTDDQKVAIVQLLQQSSIDFKGPKGDTGDKGEPGLAGASPSLFDVANSLKSNSVLIENINNALIRDDTFRQGVANILVSNPATREQIATYVSNLDNFRSAVARTLVASHLADIKGPKGDLGDPTVLESSLKPKTMWCADGTCIVPTGGNVYINSNLGIGTTAPESKLHVVDNNIILGQNDNNKWYFHTPQDKRGNILYIAPRTNDNKPDWSKQFVIDQGNVTINGNANISGKLITQTISSPPGNYLNINNGAGSGRINFKGNTIEIGDDVEISGGLKVKGAIDGSAQSIRINDTRTENLTPSQYRGNKGVGVHYEFKYSTTIGNPIPDQQFCTLKTIVPWGDKSGGPIIQIAFGGNKMRLREENNDTTWWNWKKVSDF